MEEGDGCKPSFSSAGTEKIAFVAKAEVPIGFRQSLTWGLRVKTSLNCSADHGDVQWPCPVLLLFHKSRSRLSAADRGAEPPLVPVPRLGKGSLAPGDIFPALTAHLSKSSVARLTSLFLSLISSTRRET